MKCQLAPSRKDVCSFDADYAGIGAWVIAADVFNNESRGASKGGGPPLELNVAYDCVSAKIRTLRANLDKGSRSRGAVLDHLDNVRVLKVKRCPCDTSSC